MTLVIPPPGRGNKRPPDISRYGLRPPLLSGVAWLPLAHAGHILADAAIFGVPVGSVLLTIWALNRWGPKDS
jgi:hypothetical protein